MNQDQLIFAFISTPGVAASLFEWQILAIDSPKGKRIVPPPILFGQN